MNDLVKKYDLKDSNWPSHELIEELGGKIFSTSNPRKVNFSGKIYTEGNCVDAVFFREFGKKAGVYVIKVQNTIKYKIGITKNLKRRLKEFSTGNPENIKIVYFIETIHYQSLEKHLHEIFKEYRTSGEWFSLDDDTMEIVEANLALLNMRAPSEFKVYNLKDVSIQTRVS